MYEVRLQKYKADRAARGQSYDDRNKEVSAFFAKDDEVEAKIIEIDPKQWRMVLSIRKINEDKARADLEKYNDSEEVSTNIGDKLK